VENKQKHWLESQNGAIRVVVVSVFLFWGAVLEASKPMVISLTTLGVLAGTRQAHALASRDSVLQWSIVCCRHVNLHAFVTMMGFHAVKLWQNETFHCHNQMNIIIMIHEWER
jgi:hypothetical protein